MLAKADRVDVARSARAAGSDKDPEHGRDRHTRRRGEQRRAPACLLIDRSEQDPTGHGHEPGERVIRAEPAAGPDRRELGDQRTLRRLGETGNQPEGKKRDHGSACPPIQCERDRHGGEQCATKGHTSGAPARSVSRPPG